MRMRAGAVLAALLLGACGGGGDDGDAVEIDLEEVVDIDPCGVLDPDSARDLVGGEVVEGPPDVGTTLARAVGCSYQLGDGGTGGAIAASLVMGETEEEPDVAVELRLAELGADADAAAPIDLDGADAAAVVSTEQVVHVVYVVEQVVTSVEVVPVDGVDEEAVRDVVAFVEETLPVVREAKEERDRAVAEAEGGDEEGAGSEEDEGAGDTVQAEEIEGLWTGDWGTMAIEEEDGEVRAAYTHDEGRITGTFEDGVFTGRWTEVPSRQGPSDAGSVEFRFAKTDDGTIALDGRWDYDGDAEPLGHDDWDLTLSEDEVPPELLEAFEDEEGFQEP